MLLKQRMENGTESGTEWKKIILFKVLSRALSIDLIKILKKFRINIPKNRC